MIVAEPGMEVGVPVKADEPREPGVWGMREDNRVGLKDGTESGVEIGEGDTTEDGDTTAIEDRDEEGDG